MPVSKRRPSRRSGASRGARPASASSSTGAASAAPAARREPTVSSAGLNPVPGQGSSGRTGMKLASAEGLPPTPRWWVPAMLALMIAGLLWIVVFYLSGVRAYPIPPIGSWNLAVGFGLIIVGFAMTTRWR